MGSGESTLAIIAVGAFLCGLIGAMVGAGKGNGGMGFFLGLILGPIGILIAAVMQPRAASDAGIPPPPGAPPAQWAPDPHGRHEHRYWDGRQWTRHVSNGGVQQVEGPNQPRR